MEKFIWYSIPGSVVVTALAITYSPIAGLPEAILIGLAVVVGFVVHQCFRTAFEPVGWERAWRPVIRMIRDEYGTTVQKAFLIWELVFYGKDVSDGFRDHDRGAWHYVMSFWSITFATLLAIGLVLMKKPSSLGIPWTGWIAIFGGIGAMFLLKGLLTLRAICRQECALYQIQHSKFDDAAKAITPTST